MALPISNPFAVDPEFWWQVRIGTSWTDIDPPSSATMDTAFKGSSKTIDIGPSAVLPHKAKFDIEAMTWDSMPVRRTLRVYRNALFNDDRLYSYWNDDGVWEDYDKHINNFLNACKLYGWSKTAIYVGSTGYDICLDSMIQYNRDTQRPCPIFVKGVASCDDNTLPLKFDDDSTVPESYICPITLAPMKHPVVAADGHTYERDSIKKAILEKPVSPMTNKPLAHTYLVTNHALRKDMTLFMCRRV